jgi:hypothetical protein
MHGQNQRRSSRQSFRHIGLVGSISPVDVDAAMRNSAGQSRQLGIGRVEEIAGERGKYAGQCGNPNKQPQNET